MEIDLFRTEVRWRDKMKNSSSYVCTFHGAFNRLYVINEVRRVEKKHHLQPEYEFSNQNIIL